VIQVYTIRDLERITGVTRTTIHYYLRQGLLPRPQKTAASRSLYTDEHVKILQRIGELKHQGLTLIEIEDELQTRVEMANEVTVDLVAQEHRRMHNRILAVAAQEFATKGYKNTHVTTIMRKLGITATLFYSHFPSKRRLLAECVTILMKWSNQYIDEKQRATEDPAERLLWNLFGHSRVFELGSAALAVIRVEGTEEDADLHVSMEEGLAATVDRILKDLDQEKDEYPNPSKFPGDLIALNLFGAYERVAFGSRFDRQNSRKDLLEAHLWLFLAAQAARNGEIDIDSRLARYEKLIDKLSSGLPPLPPELEVEPSADGSLAADPGLPGDAAPAGAAQRGYTKAIVPPSG
jgi:DNA-binding transcriptional MerR regulator